MVDFNCMSASLGLFHAKKLGTCVHCRFIFTFLHSFSSFLFFAHN